MLVSTQVIMWLRMGEDDAMLESVSLQRPLSKNPLDGSTSQYFSYCHAVKLRISIQLYLAFLLLELSPYLTSGIFTDFGLESFRLKFKPSSYCVVRNVSQSEAVSRNTITVYRTLGL